MMRAGASRVVSPYQIGAVRLAQTALRPAVVDFVELATSSENLELAMEQVSIGAGSGLAGRTILEANVRQRFGVIVVAIQREGGHMDFNPPHDAVMRAGRRTGGAGTPRAAEGPGGGGAMIDGRRRRRTPSREPQRRDAQGCADRRHRNREELRPAPHRVRGVPTIDADAIVHGLLAPGSGDRAATSWRGSARRWSTADGAVDRRALGALVFQDAAARRDARGHRAPARSTTGSPRGCRRRTRRGAAVGAGRDPAAVRDRPRGRVRPRDRRGLCEPEEQVRRVMARDGLSESEARARLAAQWPIAREGQAVPTDVVDTDRAASRRPTARSDAISQRWTQLGRAWPVETSDARPD